MRKPSKSLSLLNLVFILFIFCSQLSAQFSLPAETLPFKGKVRAIRTENYQCTGDPTEKPRRVWEATYDRRGNQTSSILTNADGVVTSRSTQTLNSSGQITSSTGFQDKSSYPPNGLNTRGTYNYKNGKLVEVLAFYENKLEYTVTRFYDGRGNQVRQVMASEGGTTETIEKYDLLNRLIERNYISPGYNSRSTFEYDAAGNKVKESYYDDGSHVITYIRSYEGKNLVKLVSLGNDGTVKRTTIHRYNAKGGLILTTIDDDLIASRTNFEYHTSGTMRLKEEVTVAKPFTGKRIHHDDQPAPGRILEKYDTEGRQTERYMYLANGDLHLTRLTRWDSAGNQTRLIETSPGGQYDRDITSESDSHGNRIKASCRKTTQDGEVEYSMYEKTRISYFTD